VSSSARLKEIIGSNCITPEGGGKSAAIAYTLIETAKLNDVDPQAWLTDVLGRIAEHTITKLDELMPWRYAEASA